MSNPVPIGKLIDGSAERDAIHVAILPAIAAEPLPPGTHVGLWDDGRAGCCKKPIGIVDPFLNVRCVLPGQRFYICIYPNTITSLRHDWTLPGLEPPPKAEPVTDKAASEAWLRKFADDVWPNDYDDMMAEVKRFLNDGWAWTEEGSETVRGAFYDVQETFWKHFEVVTGIKVDDDGKSSSPFSCSC